MKYLAFTLSILTFATISCKKNSDTLFEAGKTKGMIVTSHNISVKGEFEDNESMKTLELDLDANGQTDIMFISHQDSGRSQLCGQYTQDELEEMEFEGGKYQHTSTRVEIINGSFELAVQENSNRVYLIDEEEYELERPSGTTIMNDVIISKSQPSAENKGHEALYTMESFALNELISEKQLFLNQQEIAHMRSSAYESSFFYKDTLSDILYGSIRNKELDPLEVPANELRYLVFKKGDKWGWVSFNITEENRITVLESAISKR